MLAIVITGRSVWGKKYHGKTADGTIWDRAVPGVLGGSDSDVMSEVESADGKTARGCILSAAYTRLVRQAKLWRF